MPAPLSFGVLPASDDGRLELLWHEARGVAAFLYCHSVSTISWMEFSS